MGADLGSLNRDQLRSDPLSSGQPGRPAWLGSWLRWLDAAVHREILRLRTRYELSLDELRGLYVSDELVDALRANIDKEPADDRDRAEAYRLAGLHDLRASFSPLRVVAEEFGLSDAQVCALIICLAPEVKLDYQPLYAYLADDVTRRRPTVDLCQRLIGGGAELLNPRSPLFADGLVEVIRAADDGTWRGSGLVLADPARTYLLGLDRTEPVGRPERRRVLLVQSGDTLGVATQLAAEDGREVVRADEQQGRALCDLLIHARLRGQVLHSPVPATPAVAEAVLAVPVHLVLGAEWLPHLGEVEYETAVPTATAASRVRARHDLASLAQRVPLTYTWDDLVLPSATLARLRELSSAVGKREEVFDRWGFRRLSGGHSSLRMLFTGSSGTGKTMSAAVVARGAGVELFQVDVSAVVSKYIGETEKNLEAIFWAAQGSDVMLFFDEADALFGKRSEVSDAHDRYANIEASYLLQRIERYDGVLILASNLASNMDEAFSRRMHGEIEFPLPDKNAREALWRMAFPPSAPVADDVNPALLASQFQLTGGEIRNVALAAAFLAAHERTPIGVSHVMRSLARQRHRQGKLPSLAEFGQYLHLVRAE